MFRNARRGRLRARDCLLRVPARDQVDRRPDLRGWFGPDAPFHSNTAEYGDLTRGEQVVGDATRAAMKKTLADIQSGEFAREWIAENKSGCHKFNALREKEKQHPIEIVG